MPCRLDTWDAITSRGGVFNTFLLPPHYRRVERHAEEFGRLMGSGLWALLANFACTGETLETNATADFTATKASLQRMAGQYLQGADPRTPLASPLYANLSGLSPLLVVVGGAEALLDDSVRLARSAGMAGVDVTLYIGAGMQHIFPIYCGVIPESDAAVAMIGAWIRSRTSPEDGEPAHNSKDETVPAPGQDSDEASPT